MKILLAIDGSEHSEAAIDEVARQHFLADSEVRVISVLEMPFFPTMYPGGGVSFSLYEKSEHNAGTIVEKAAAKLRADEQCSQFNITTKVLTGSPKGAILEEAEAFGADLIVVGSHGYGMLERLLLGSVSQSVALNAKCSVEIVRGSKAQSSMVKERAIEVADEKTATERWENEGGNAELT